MHKKLILLASLGAAFCGSMNPAHSDGKECVAGLLDAIARCESNFTGCRDDLMYNDAKMGASSNAPAWEGYKTCMKCGTETSLSVSEADAAVVANKWGNDFTPVAGSGRFAVLGNPARTGFYLENFNGITSLKGEGSLADGATKIATNPRILKPCEAPAA